MSTRTLFGSLLNKLKGVARKAPPDERAKQEATVGAWGLSIPRGTQAAGGELEPSVPADSAVQQFLYWGQWYDKFYSSNVSRIRYDNASQTLTVEFLNHGSTYEYPGVDVDLAYTFAMAVSKGRWVWENLRNAGRACRFLFSADGHRPDPSRKTVVFSQKAERRVKARLQTRAATAVYERQRQKTTKKRRGLFAVFAGRK